MAHICLERIHADRTGPQERTEGLHEHDHGDSFTGNSERIHRSEPGGEPHRAPVATLAAKAEHRSTLFASSYPLILLIALTILLGVTYLSLITGRYPLELDELFRILGKNWFGMDLKVYKPAENMLLTVRIPRLLAAGLIGAALAIAGATFQAVFRNPLVSPYLLGVSQGASVGAASAILLGVGTSIAIQGSALAGGLAAVLLTVSIPAPAEESVHAHAGALRRDCGWLWHRRAGCVEVHCEP